MGSRRIFLDTSGLFAWINSRDPHHALMLSLPHLENVRLIVTDYIIDEACTLFLARNIGHRRADILRLLRGSKIVQMEWIGRETFWKAWEWQTKFHDHPFSFTNCTSFSVMNQLGLREAATNDAQFQTAGYVSLFA